MAGLLHVAVGVAAARWEHTRERPLLPSLLASSVLFAGLSLAPDLDVLGFVWGVPYAAPWGHRGATHSLLFAGLLALLVALLARRAARPFLRTLLLVFTIVASHGVLDSMTNGGLGVALLWPISTKRHFAPWTPIPVSPVGRGLLSVRGLYVASMEALACLPLLFYARRWQRPPYACSQGSKRAPADPGNDPAT